MIINTERLLKAVKNNLELKHAKYKTHCAKNISLIKFHIGSELNKLLSDNDLTVRVPIYDGESDLEYFATYVFKSGEFRINTNYSDSFCIVTSIDNDYQLLAILSSVSSALSISGLHQK